MYKKATDQTDFVYSDQIQSVKSKTVMNNKN